MRLILGLWLLIVVLAPAPLVAQQDPPADLDEAIQRRLEASRLQARAVAAFGAGDIDAARSLLEQQLELEPGNPLALYNLACVQCVGGDREAALATLQRAIEHGFVDFEQMRRDPNLADLHETDLFRSILANRTPILDAAGDLQFEAAKKKYGPRYVYERDEDLKLSFASAYDEQTLAQVREELRHIAEWALSEVFTDLRDPPMREADPWVLVVLPSERDFRRWAIMRYGPSAVTSDFHRIGGSYSHDAKELVAMDLGGTLRHEFLHVLHWRSNMRQAQGHPVWIQEGLCSLVEDYDTKGGRLVPAPSWRTNMVKRLERARRLMPIADLARMDRETFNNERPLAHYGLARAVFLYLYQRGVLRDWYAHYTTHFAEDPTGIEAIEFVLGMSIDEVQDDFRRWVALLDEAPEARSDGTIGGLDVSLGVQVDPGRGEGPIVTGVSREARAGGLRVRDVITAIEGRPVRDMNDFVRILADYRAGQTVRVRVHRRRAHMELEVRVVARR